MTLSSRRLSWAVGLCALALAPAPAAAVDGVIEINQARALAGGVTPSDLAGFPVTIDSPGSYRLTSNLVVNGHDAIETTGPGLDVMLDLNGFTISLAGTACCTAIRFGTDRARIRNGFVVGFLTGIASGANTVVESMQLSGVAAPAPSSSRGVAAGNYAVVTDSVVDSYYNGIDVGPGSVVRGCTSRSNTFLGVSTGVSSLVSGNTVHSNVNAGIAAADGSTIIGNTVNDNLIGISVRLGSTVLDNTVRSNRDLGIAFFFGTGGYGHNVLTNNNHGDSNPQVDGGVEIGPNVCGDHACP